MLTNLEVDLDAAAPLIGHTTGCHRLPRLADFLVNTASIKDHPRPRGHHATTLVIEANPNPWIAEVHLASQHRRLYTSPQTKHQQLEPLTEAELADEFQASVDADVAPDGETPRCEGLVKPLPQQPIQR